MGTANGDTKVLVTGASGFIATHCVKQLLDEGYQVRGTVRSLNNKKKIDPLRELPGSESLELVEADLEKDDNWLKAMDGCAYVLHVASPFPVVADMSTISTAVDGTKRVLEAAASTGTVKKVVLTSSCAAVCEGHPNDKRKVFTEMDWTDCGNSSVLDYARSKTLAEKFAWSFMKGEDVNFKLTTINPALVIGPLLHNAEGTSITIMRRFLSNQIPAVPAVKFGLVDVRDVAEAHIKAMRNPDADGRRFLVTYQPSYSFLDIANVLRAEFANQGYWLPKFTVPYTVLWCYSFFDKEAAQVLHRVGKEVFLDNTCAQEILGMKFRNPDQSLIEMAYDIIDRGMAPKRKGYKRPTHG